MKPMTLNSKTKSSNYNETQKFPQKLPSLRTKKSITHILLLSQVANKDLWRKYLKRGVI